MDEKKCSLHVPMHMGGGEVVCEICGESCAFLTVMDKKDEKEVFDNKE